MQTLKRRIKALEIISVRQIAYVRLDEVLAAIEAETDEAETKPKGTRDGVSEQPNAAATAPR